MRSLFVRQGLRRPLPRRATGSSGGSSGGGGGGSAAVVPWTTRPLSTTTATARTGEAEGPSTKEDFGYRKVDAGEKEGLVRGVFSSVADSYDVMNDLMSGGVHRLWKDDFVKNMGVPAMLSASQRPLDVAGGASTKRGLRFLDVAGGTGDIAFRIIDALGPAMAGGRRRGGSGGGGSEGAAAAAADDDDDGAPRVVISDINPEMLRVGKTRAEKRFGAATLEGVEFVEANAEALPFEDDSFDVYSIAFGLRNVTTTRKALEEARRVLKPGGRFLCLEFSTVPASLAPLGQVYDAWSFHAIPLIGQVVTGDRDSYQYLVESIRLFPDQETLKGMMADAGFQHASYVNYTGGVVAVHSGFKM